MDNEGEEEEMRTYIYQPKNTSPYTKDDGVRFQMVADLCKGAVLDVGCGMGELKKYLKTGYVGIDTNPEGDIFYGSVYNLNFTDKSVDTVVLLEVLEHLEHPIEALLELKRVMKEQLIISVPNPYSLNQIVSVAHHGIGCRDPDHMCLFGDNEIYNLCYGVGFKNVQPVRFYTKIPGIQWLSPIRSVFGEWSIYVVT